MIRNLSFLILITLFFSACNSTKTIAYKETSQENIDAQIVALKNIKPVDTKELTYQTKSYTNEPKEDLSVNNDEIIKDALMEFYDEWKHVKYKFGGNSKKGIDCSAFTQRIFKEKFNIKIPRSTRTQVKIGEKIKKSELKIGDLVFFKTGRTDRHVGVYMGDGKFMHASIKGVKFTKIDKAFYRKTYWTSRRVIEDL
ncbi:NlpC/P60 family protein [Arcobacter sp. YIC-464]|uniref:NlpC/P60 family protein n=1 Tax=Arcobacter sp. YIC-464 TaxID=3376631 RepID=UPI003C2A4F55